MATQNLAVKFCGILQSQSDEEVTAREWRLLGQEQDGSQLLSWISDKGDQVVQNIGVYTNRIKTLATLHTFDEPLNIIQASVNPSRTLLTYVVKILPTEESENKEALYCPYLICMLPDKSSGPEAVEQGSTKQIMVQYVYGKSNKYSPGIRNDRFLLFKHLEYIKIYRTPLFLNECDDGTEKWGFDGIYTDTETIVKVFSWAQWDCVNQILYYIHYRAATQSFAEGEEVKSPAETTPTLSALQFHADLPYETVLNIPLSLPGGAEGAACGAYEDDAVPLRVHDCSLDLAVLTDARGILAICHHYLYKPLDDSTTSLVLDDSVDLKDSGVNFAYSITVLQHGCVIHTVVPDLPWSLAKSLRPSYILYAEHHVLVRIPMLYTHLIDVSPTHEPCCHLVVCSEEQEAGPALAPALGWGPHHAIDPSTLHLHTIALTDRDLTAAFKGDPTLGNRLAILHYLIVHEGNMELADDLISWLCVNQRGCPLVPVLQEYLVATAHALTRRSLPQSAAPLLQLLPLTAHLRLGDARAGSRRVLVSVESVWGGAAVVLSPRQRVSQFAEDVWTRLWAALHHTPPRRLHPSTVIDKLRVSLHCYQPEALSRCSTPLSPMGGPPPGLPQRRPSAGGAQDMLPFFELDICTASKQEHVIAANLREASVHMLRCSEGAGGGGVGGGAGEAGGVHAAATRWAGAQLEAARALCRALLRALAATPHSHQHRGFTFIDELEPTHAYIVFKVLEQYYLAAEAVAFPLPHGFSSFFTYLGYRTLPFHAFVQHVHRHVFELQIDVMKAIVTSKDDSKRTVNNKLRLIQVVGEGRARRALGAWPHRAALILRARDHAHTLLTGAAHAHPRDSRHHRPGPDTGIAALPSGERLSPLDTFLDLLTAKASLNELDFNLIIEATLASVQQDTAV